MPGVVVTAAVVAGVVATAVVPGIVARIVVAATVAAGVVVARRRTGAAWVVGVLGLVARPADVAGHAVDDGVARNGAGDGCPATVLSGTVLPVVVLGTVFPVVVLGTAAGVVALGTVIAIVVGVSSDADAGAETVTVRHSGSPACSASSQLPRISPGVPLSSGVALGPHGGEGGNGEADGSSPGDDPDQVSFHGGGLLVVG